MDIILMNTMSSGLLDSIKYLLFNKKDKNIIIDPFSCIIKLSLLSYQTEGTKISINDNQIFFNQPSYGQGLIRYLYGDGREDLHNLFKPIQKSVEWYKIPSLQDINYLFNRAILGLLTLKKSYGKYETIQHTIDYYITILNGNMTNINIEDMTQSILESVKSKKKKENRTENSDTTEVESKSKNYEYRNSKNRSKKDKYNENKNNTSQNHIQSNNQSNNSQINNQNSNQNSNNQNSNNQDSNNQNSNNQHNNQSSNNQHNDNQVTVEENKRQTNDLELFLKNLWSKDEIIIVINLFKEFSKKDETNDQKYIFDSIINYCRMKENNLHKYIEERSSILE